MELDLEGTNANVVIDDDSESEYEGSSDGGESEDDSSQDEKPKALSRASSLRSQKASDKRRSKKSGSNELNHGSFTSELDEVVSQNLPEEHIVDEEFREEAKTWAANFVAPQTREQIRSPPRREGKSRKRKQGDQPPHVPSQIRAKRLRSFYSNDYRKLLNAEIHDALTLGSMEGQIALANSQIGSSMWTAKEKDVFFSALERLGRDDVARIALHIGSKSELEVQEYIHVLDEALKLRLAEDNRKETLQVMDCPAVLEISEECCGVLERAAEALSTRQDCYEIGEEEGKWYGNSWLLTQNLSKTIHKQRRDPEEEAEIEAALPAANFFNLKNWLELSQEIFMNRGPPDGESHWESLAEPGELPAIRTTAFDDFYSLAVSITKRLISAMLFCNMSRQKARQSNLIKHAVITPEDVEAAVKMLGLQINSHEFWVKCARRCSLRVIDDVLSVTGDDIFLTYEEVELAMAGDGTSNAHSHILSETEQRQHSTVASKDRVGLEGLTGLPSETENSSSDDSWHSIDFNQSDEEEVKLSSFTREESKKRKIERKKNMLRAQEEYMEALDLKDSQLEEAQLWSMLHQTAPFPLQPTEVLERPRYTKPDADEVSSWRENTDYWSPWEMMSTPVPSQSFVNNRKVKSKRARRKERMAMDIGREENLSAAGDIQAPEDIEIGVQEHHSEPEDGGEQLQVDDETDDYEQLENERIVIQEDYEEHEDYEGHEGSVERQNQC